MEIEYWLKKEKWNVYEGLLLLANFNPNRTNVVFGAFKQSKSIDSRCANVKEGVLLDKHLEDSMKDCRDQLENSKKGYARLDPPEHIKIMKALFVYFDHQNILSELYRSWLQNMGNIFIEDDLHPVKFYIDWVKDQNHVSKVSWWNDDLCKKYLVGNKDEISISKDENLKWNDITVTFINENEIHVQFKHENVTRHYNNVGFGDHRGGGHGKNPIQAWLTLFEMSKRGGAISWEFTTRKKIEKIAQKIRKKFRALFPGIDLSTDPVPIASSNNVYKTTFLLKPPSE